MERCDARNRLDTLVNQIKNASELQAIDDQNRTSILAELDEIKFWKDGTIAQYREEYKILTNKIAWVQEVSSISSF